jgi:hypothetical protein
MTLKTGRAHRNVTVASLTKLTFAGDRYSPSVGIPGCVAIDTFRQAVLKATYAIPDRIVSAMLEKIHMVATHYLSGCYAAIH